MLRFSTLAALLLVALWVPATLHCRLEGLGLAKLFSCPTESTHAGGDECADVGCKSVEDGQFARSKSRTEPASLPALVCQCVHCLLLVAPPAPTAIAFCPEEPLWLQRTWQFEHRAALPARAPSLNS